MNGPARAMSAIPGRPRHLIDWLGGECDNELIPRNTYGHYLREILDDALHDRPDFRVVRNSVIDIESAASGYRLRDALGVCYHADNVVLAFGTLAPDDSFLPTSLRAHPEYVGDPWNLNPSELRDGNIALIGSGLTALDIIALLDERGYDGTIHLVSRHALLPRLENPLARGLDPATLVLDTRTPYALLHSLRRAIAEHTRNDGDWREVLESLRSLSPAIWSGWSERERRRFLRHLQPFWSVHRYRVPAQTSAAFERFVQRGRIVRHRGRVRNALHLPNGMLSLEIASTQSRSAFEVSTVINCTGPNSDYARAHDPLIANLMRRGMLRADRLRLGIDATSDLAILDRSGRPQPHLFTLGAPLRGQLYETTAVPETREQAAHIANALLSMHASMPLEAVS